MMASQLDDRDTGVPEDPSDVPSHEDGQKEPELSQQLENSKISTPSTNTTCLNPEIPQREKISVLCKVNSLGQVPTRIKGGTPDFENSSLFFDYRVKVPGIEWSDLDTIVSKCENDSDSDASYEYQSEESDEDAEEFTSDLGEEECNDGEELGQSEEVLESPIAGTFGHKREPEEIMPVLGPTEITDLLGRVLWRLPSEKIVCLDEIQTLISKLEGDELREAVRNSLSPFFDAYIPGENPHYEIVLWRIKRALGIDNSERRTPLQLFFSRSEVYSALESLPEDGYLGLRCFLSDALISWGTDSAMKVLWKHIAKLGDVAQRWIENYARIELDKLQELAPMKGEVLALDDE